MERETTLIDWLYKHYGDTIGELLEYEEVGMKVNWLALSEQMAEHWRCEEDEAIDEGGE